MKENDQVTQESAFTGGLCKKEPVEKISGLNLTNFWPQSGNQEIIVVPIGGVGRIGMNWTLYGWQDEWLLVDAGIGFHETDPDVRAVIPDPAILHDLKDRLVGLIVTHAHQDHIGAIDKVWPYTLNCPIWVTPFALGLLEEKFKEAKTLDKVVFNKFLPGSSFNIGSFAIETVAVTHSIPEPVALAITLPIGTIVHSGDWKIDHSPVIGMNPDIEGLERIGRNGVLALISDSTNAAVDLEHSSEWDVAEGFDRVFQKAQGIVIVVCFGSNVARLASAAQAAKFSGRKIAVAGRSMQTSEKIASALGLIDSNSFLSSPRHLYGLARDEISLICTGGQGEAAAALARVAEGNLKGIPPLGIGDTVILSSRVIPGNEQALELILNKLLLDGVDIVRNNHIIDGYPVHVSGHAGKQEIEYLYSLLKPKFSVPVHGKQHHLSAHAEIARDCGSEVFISGEGEILGISPRGIFKRGQLDLPLINLKANETMDSVYNLLSIECIPQEQESFTGGFYG